MLKKELIDFAVDPLWKVSEVRELLRQHDILKPVPTHQTLINFINNPKHPLQGFQEETNNQYLIRQTSLLAWIKGLQEG